MNCHTSQEKVVLSKWNQESKQLDTPEAKERDRREASGIVQTPKTAKSQRGIEELELDWQSLQQHNFARPTLF